MNNNKGLKILISILMIGLIVLAFKSSALRDLGESPETVSYSTFVNEVENHNVARGTINDNTFSGEYLRKPVSSRSSKFNVDIGSSGNQRDLIKLLLANHVKFDYTHPLFSPLVQNLLISFLLPFLLIVVLWIWFMRQAQSGGNQALSFGRSRAKRLTDSVPKITFDDVAGVDEAKQELEEIVEFLKNAKKFQALGAKIPKGVLLLGPPGCGKTLLARAVAGEANVPFFHISGSDFVEMFVGVGASRVRDLFETAKSNRPSLIFIDEIDAVGRLRGAGLGGGHDEREQTLNQLLVEMDGFDPNAGVILIAATNRPDVLDPALLRPGRFDRRVVVDSPDFRGRAEILRVHLRGKPLDFDHSEEEREKVVKNLAQRTPGFTGADIMNLVNEAALLAARRNKTKVSIQEFEESIDRVIAGPERKSRVMTEAVRRRTAYHEVGHAIVGETLEHADPIHKVSILPRGMALGYTISLPSEDRYNMTKSELEDSIAMALGGRVAEQVVFGEMDTGASRDLDQATDVARAMVCEYGMSERLGPLRLGRRHGSPFLGRDIMEDRDYSEEVAQAIDEEVRSIIDQCYQHAKQILTQKRDKLELIASVLLEKEVLEREAFVALLKGDATAIEPSKAPPSDSSGPFGTPEIPSPKEVPAPPLFRPEPGVA